MDSFIVSARKYRPATFATVVGQASITNTLKNAILNQQIAQAFLFTGPRGVGKTTCARIMAKTINCQSLTPEGEACGACESCVSFDRSASFNIYELDAASNNSVDDIRSLVEQVRIPPQSGKYKVYIIDEVHMLSTAAFNAFLKTLEEPPPYVKFILATTEKHKILPTILSRCQIFDFRRISVEDIAHHLAFVATSENVEADPDALHIVAQKADGGLRDALSMFDQLVSFAGNKLTYKQVIENLNVLDHDYYFKITDYILQGNISQTLLTINEIIDNGFDGQHFIIGLGQHFRSLLVSQDQETVQLLETSSNIRNLYLKQSSACNAAFLVKVLEINNQCDLDYKISNNKRLHLEIALMQMCRLANPNGQKPEVSITYVAPQHSPAKPVAPVSVSQPPVMSEPQTKVSEPEPEIKPIEFAKPVETIEVVQSVEHVKQVEFVETVKAEQPSIDVMQPVANQSESDQQYSTQEPEKIEAQPEKIDPMPPAPTPEAPKHAARSTFSGINFGDLVNPASTKNKSGEGNEGDKEEILPPDRTPFTQADLERVWKPMAESVSKDQANLYHSLINRIPFLDEDFKIVATVDNKIQHSEMFLKLPEILQFLRSELKNWGIQLEIIVADRPQESRRPYTDEDKLNAMIDKNPAIKSLKDQLNLDIDY